MLDFLEIIPAEWRPMALFIFVVGGALSAVLTYHRGKRAGPEKPRVQEFYAAGQLADMGPVKELVEQTGLLIQQQLRTNLALERCAVAMENATAAYQGQIAHQATQDEVEERAQQLFERRLAAERPKPRRRAPARKKPTSPSP